MTFFNDLMGFVGFFGWCWVWWFNRYNTSGCMRIQIGVIAMGVVWLMVILAETIQQHTPTSGTVLARFSLLLGMWLLTPLLKYHKTCAIEQEVKS